MTKKIFIFFCLLCVTASMGFAEKLNDDYNVIVIKAKHESGGTARPDTNIPITAAISGNTLSISFTQNIGIVTVEISNSTGTVESFNTATPDNVQTYITSSGSYTVTFTLPGGDEYYGNFVVF